MLRSNRGFTLIELLVVIAIIGILSSVVLASLTTARTKGQAAAVQSQLSSMRAQAELYYSTSGNSYGSPVALNNTGNCSTSGTGTLFGADANSLAKLLGGLPSTVNTACVVASGGTAWAVAASNPSDPTTAYCVDSTGTSKEKTGLSSGAHPSAAITGSACN